MHYPLKKPAIFLLSFFLISFLFVFAANDATARKHRYTAHVNKTETASANDNSHEATTEALYEDLHLHESGMKEEVFSAAVHGMEKLEEEGKVANPDLISIIDFSQPSNQKRLYVLDLKNRQTLFNTLVAHGKNTGQLWATSFSNKLSSLKSSPGFYITAETYMGDNGYSLRLDGQEQGINDNARRRAIVMHGAYYASPSMVESMGFLGRSWGCPAVPVAEHQAIIDSIKGGSVLFIYTNDRNYAKKSTLFNS